MSTVKEIEDAIQQLATNEKWEIHNWLSDQMSDEWDRQIEKDAEAGKLDKLWEKARTDIEAGRVLPLDEFLNHQPPTDTPGAPINYLSRAGVSV